MIIKKNEKIVLTNDETKLLTNTLNLLKEIFQAATDCDICGHIDDAENAIVDLLDYCE